MMPLFVFVEVTLGSLCFAFATYMTFMFFSILFTQPEYTLPAIVGVVTCLGMLAGLYYFFVCSPLVYDRAFGRLLVYEDRVVYKCFLRKPIKMSIEEIQYTGVEDYHLLNGGLPEIRGDEVSFIYLSTNPYPEKYRGKISLLKPKTGFIKISYTDKLAEALIEILPAEKDNLIRAFYGKMKTRDMVLAQKKREKKNRKKK
jgi:hypothetical protein